MKYVFRPSGLETHSDQSSGYGDLGNRVLETTEPDVWQCEAVQHWIRPESNVFMVMAQQPSSLPMYNQARSS